MPKLKLVDAVLIVSLILLIAAAGRVGGAGFAPDIAVIRLLQTWRTEWPELTSLVIVVTQLGSAYVTIGAALLAAGWLSLKRERGRAIILAGAVLGERALLDGLKMVIERARPTLDAHLVATHSSSFPSGHAGNTMAVFLSIALIAVPPSRRRVAVFAAAILSVVIGLTRPYLGVHWPSDVVAGWALGVVVALIAWQIAERSTTKQQH